ncbi:hypothetical protein GCM10027321_47280 [Massilia terrae]|uniref:DUF3482 domain-containing protein n=1 Tax=Massilia terrae TaxID=1811224 RepID=A0ABT2D4Q8_9BURK|nr:DUF3482 domain-containing protein [Massilia terrae]MCS0661230.1 DUF3482 domain-containing protein [Massilia terrae]
MNAAPVTIQFALVSHTNNGKTTLARTLTGVDVGEVRDAAHVTVFAESHPLLTTKEGDTLVLWDTPGFGDSVRLLKRLAMSGNPIGWFMREVFDRYRDRTFWLSQQALRAARDQADVVLYLVNSAEQPRDAGYLPPEMKILEWLGKPVVVLLNQMGPPRPGAEELAEQERWRDHLAQYPAVRSVLALDAFARCWVHEHVFYGAIGQLIEPSRREAYARLQAAWEAHNLQRYRAAVRVIAAQLVDATRDGEPVEVRQGGLVRAAMQSIGLARDREKAEQAAMAALVERLNTHIGRTTTALLALHKLDPGEAAKINSRVRENFAVRAPLDKAQAGLLGAILSGAATGLSADLMAGGLTFGGGALLGAIVGGLTMAGAAWGFNRGTDREHPSVQFADAFLHTMLVGAVLRYLAVAHFGRGRGNFVESESPPFWQVEVEAAVDADDSALWQQLRSAPSRDEAVALLVPRLGRIIDRVLARLYPHAALNGTGTARTSP